MNAGRDHGLLRTIAGRLLRLVPVLFFVSTGTFLMLELIPGDPALAVLGPSATPAQYEQLRQEMGLDAPLRERYTDWFASTLQGDLGQTLTPPVRDVSELILSRLPVTLELAALALAMALAIAIPVGLVAAHRRASQFDRVASGIAFATISVPPFLTALVLVFLLVFNPAIAQWGAVLAFVAAAVWIASGPLRRGGGKLPLARQLASAGGLLGVAALLFVMWPELPRQGFVRLTSPEGALANVRSLFLPALTLALFEAAVFMRLLRNDLIGTLQENFILASRAKGMPAWRILLRDALRPSSFSLITVAGVSLGRLIGGTIIVETIFNLPGMGNLILTAIGSNDFRVLQASVLVIATFYVVVNAVIDISYAYLDPRIRRGSA